ncbi:outer membrane protein assembly factor BamB [Paenarthrobacter nicotinovorans]|uniref:PQQ-binding-like beta-propeller repeat protein n=1 Tax=Paenarthrobacter nicotinovorans TaxID=29320 RepID=UPI002785C1C7|nr:PQQ-binding-like beta-propeller repeat protein [Paenarthrobacter nicotinovorans]MDP9936271.1 outer membrane protein assembly factor BamB [Paenarthrobacter nicotinovorans]
MTHSRPAMLRARFTSFGLGALAIGTAVLLSACTMLPLPRPAESSATTPPATAEVPDRNKETATAAWEVALEPIGQPVVTDGVALVYTRVSGGVEAHALSVATGKELWKQPVHPGLDTPGTPLEPVVTKTYSGKSAAIFLQAATPPADNGGFTWWTSPVAFDLTTGKELYRGKTELVTTRPYACEDVDDMCFITFDPEYGSFEHWVDLDLGEDEPDITPLSGFFRPVGKELYSMGSGGVESLAHVRHGKVVWEVELEKIFGKGASTDLGVHFVYSEKLDLYVGSVGINPTPYARDKVTKETHSMNLRDTTKTVGFRASSGRVLWTADGSQVECSDAMGTQATKLEGGDAFPVRCEYVDGFIEFPAGTYRGGHSKVVGYDPLTGSAAWESKPVEVHSWGVTGLIPSASHGEFLIAGTYWASNLVDTRTGKYRGASFEDAFVCWEYGSYEVPTTHTEKDYSGDGTAAGEYIAFPCLKSGSPAPAFTYGALTDVSTTDHDMAVISLEDKVAGYKLLQEFV